MLGVREYPAEPSGGDAPQGDAVTCSWSRNSKAARLEKLAGPNLLGGVAQETGLVRRAKVPGLAQASLRSERARPCRGRRPRSPRSARPERAAVRTCAGGGRRRRVAGGVAGRAGAILPRLPAGAERAREFVRSVSVKHRPDVAHSHPGVARHGGREQHAPRGLPCRALMARLKSAATQSKWRHSRAPGARHS
jgi:hypothetical protein